MKTKHKTIQQVMRDLFRDQALLKRFKWPPDAFALTSILLADSGAYRCAVDPPMSWPPNSPLTWSKKIEREGTHWRRWFRNDKPPSKKLRRLIRTLERKRFVLVSSISSDWRLCAAVLELHAIADAACVGLGIGWPEEVDSRFHRKGFLNLTNNGSLADIEPCHVRVLPKLRTPNVGISLRSLSHHLAIDRSEVRIEWDQQIGTNLPKDQKFNLLIIPLPFEMAANSFQRTRWPLRNMDASKFGFFRFRPKKNCDFKVVENLIKAAKRKVSEVHGVVFPESAIRREEIKVLERILGRHGVQFYVCGVRDKKRNTAYFGMSHGGKFWVRSYQDKHHRWLIDKKQIEDYHLKSVLGTSRSYWEAISVKPRKINFFCLNEWLTICHLICEDLARHDPVTHVVRSVGPNLVIALLLDGPQLRGRWPDRYAGVLADDPGSSVLTVTSLGMAKRSRPPRSKEERVIALWKDQESSPEQIVLKPRHRAAILKLEAKFVVESTADGRTDKGAASRIVRRDTVLV